MIAAGVVMWAHWKTGEKADAHDHLLADIDGRGRDLRSDEVALEAGP